MLTLMHADPTCCLHSAWHKAESQKESLRLLYLRQCAGEKVERLSVSCTGSAAPAALEPERIHLLAEAAQQTSPAKGPDFAVFEDR